MDGQEIVTLTRDELYKLVWSRPMSQLSREYSISDVGLAKICKKHKVPYPPRGYWAKVRNGHKVRTPALTTVVDLDLQGVELYKRKTLEEGGPAQDKLLSLNKTEKHLEERIHVAQTLTAPHPLVVRTVRSLENARPNPDGLAVPKAAKCLNVRVAPNSVDRAARLMDALIKALEARNYNISIGEEDFPKTWVTILGQRVSLRLEEVLERQEKIQSFFNHRQEYDRVPTGRLTFLIDDALGSGYRRTWTDGKKLLDGQLHAVVKGLVTASRETKSVHLANERRERERKEEERLRLEAERQKREEEARRADFARKLERWEQAQRIRAFVAAVQAKADGHPELQTPGGQLDRWLAWALRRAELLDPLTTVRAEDTWPPPEGLKVHLSDQRGSAWSTWDYGGTPIAAPDIAPFKEGSGSAPIAPSGQDSATRVQDI
jgi:hypothetical protein